MKTKDILLSKIIRIIAILPMMICLLEGVYAQNVGIGTNTPTSPLTVMSNNNGKGVIQKWGGVEVGFYANEAFAFVQTWSPHDLHFATSNGLSRMMIQHGTGNIGIGTGTPSALLHVDLGSSNSQGLLITGSQNNNSSVPDLGAGSRLMFYPGKAAFRAGVVNGTQWDDLNIGQGSIAMGNNSIASGLFSLALGFNTTAKGNYSLALGLGSEANGARSLAMGDLAMANASNSLAMGYDTKANGLVSTAMGANTIAKASTSLSIGYFNDDSDDPNPQNPQASDRLFQIGNGSTNLSRRNAMTVLRNGNTGIGILNPTHRLEVAGRMRIVSGGTGSTSAGIWLNKNDNSGQLGFVGVDGNNDIGIFNQTSGWSFLVRDATGNAWVKGTVTANGVTLTSDERLKKDITPLGNAMPLLEKLHGYQYHWKDETADAGLQTGLLAQEVEKVMPELVMTDEKGMKSVNYMGLIPYMLEAVKFQQSTIAGQQQQINELEKLVEMLIKK
jgi:hypothetical protein